MVLISKYLSSKEMLRLSLHRNMRLPLCYEVNAKAAILIIKSLNGDNVMKSNVTNVINHCYK